MKLNFIKTDKCPVCGCDVVVYEEVETDRIFKKIREHATGGRWEYRKFACGCVIHYCPNFRKEEIKANCSRDPKVIERERRLKEAQNILKTEVDNLEIDLECKARLKDAIESVWI